MLDRFAPSTHARSLPPPTVDSAVMDAAGRSAWFILLVWPNDSTAAHAKSQFLDTLGHHRRSAW